MRNALIRARSARRQHRMGADQAGDHAAAVDVADQHHRHIGRLGKAHIGDVAGAQIDLGRAPRALDQDDVGALPDPREALQHLRQQLALRLPYSRARIVPKRRPCTIDLRAGLALRLEQHRVHVDRRREPRRARLQRLRPADLAAIGGHRGIVRHVLRLERRDLQPAPPAAPGTARRRSSTCRHGCRCPGSSGQGFGITAKCRSKLDPLLRLHARAERMLDHLHLGDEVGDLDQRRRARCGR